MKAINISPNKYLDISSRVNEYSEDIEIALKNKRLELVLCLTEIENEAYGELLFEFIWYFNKYGVPEHIGEYNEKLFTQDEKERFDSLIIMIWKNYIISDMSNVRKIVFLGLNTTFQVDYIILFDQLSELENKNGRTEENTRKMIWTKEKLNYMSIGIDIQEGFQEHDRKTHESLRNY